jgi:methyl-accepting chemotaxis protein
MRRHWTFGQKMAAGFATTVAMAIAIGVVAVYALRTVVAAKDRVIQGNVQVANDAQDLQTATDRKVAATRGYLLTRDSRFLDEMTEARKELTAVIARLRAATPEETKLLDTITAAEAEHQKAMDRAIALRRTDAPIEAVNRVFDQEISPRRVRLDTQVRAYLSRQEEAFKSAAKAASETASSAASLVLALAVVLVAFALGIAVVLTRILSRQIGAAAGNVQSSSAELQAAANQQAAGAKELATAMSEITTTMSELLATSRQIAEGAQRVSQIAEQTASSARTGEETLDKAQEAIVGIRRQVDLVVGHMLELGKRSQQIGAVLEIVSELAEQTNILAINATIEAAGAGEGGRRFAIVADEIRKLADRVADSTKEIRGLIDDVRSAVNTTVMATEMGSKAVDAGAKHFGELAASFRHIGGAVIAATEAAREIGLSTKQQSTAVEQVNVAIANVAQASRETEASSSQTLQTVSQLAVLSRELFRLVQHPVGG